MLYPIWHYTFKSCSFRIEDIHQSDRLGFNRLIPHNVLDRLVWSSAVTLGGWQYSPFVETINTVSMSSWGTSPCGGDVQFYIVHKGNTLWHLWNAALMCIVRLSTQSVQLLKPDCSMGITSETLGPITDKKFEKLIAAIH